MNYMYVASYKVIVLYDGCGKKFIRGTEASVCSNARFNSGKTEHSYLKHKVDDKFTVR